MGCGCDNKVDVITDTTSHNCVILVLTLLRFHYHEEINRHLVLHFSFPTAKHSPLLPAPIKNFVLVWTVIIFSAISDVEKLVGLRGHRFQMVRAGKLENWKIFIKHYMYLNPCALISIDFKLIISEFCFCSKKLFGFLQ